MRRNGNYGGLKATVGMAAFAVAVFAAGGCLLAKDGLFHSGLPSADFGGRPGEQDYAGREDVSWEEAGQDVPAQDSEAQMQELSESAQKIADAYSDIYEEAAGHGALMSPDAMKRMVARLGESGYAAVDGDNQVDMAGAEQVLEFCRQVSAGEDGSLTIVELSYLGDFTQYDLRTSRGMVDVVRSCWGLTEDGPKNKSTVCYPADFWEYTQEGYLIFEGSSFAQDYYLLSMSGTPLHTALRVLPLEEECRELNRRYIIPIGYERNDLFLFDWNEVDFGEIDFYDLYDAFYEIKYNKYVPYTAGESAGTGMVYEIPSDEFEAVIMTYLDIDRGILRSKTKYMPESDCYEYRPRGFFDAENPDVPYPEVVNCRENGDGTLTLTVNAVYPKRNLSKAYAHEVVIRPLSDGGVRYVSNKILSSADDDVGSWHVSRLTEEEWKRAYGEAQ